ncbi:MAG: hypothetical protein H0U47_11565 [Nocardioidaceae bacterium]|nr:hypothetical protein [Nocardioidaceae bacterium]
MAWTWRFETRTGETVEPPEGAAAVFPAQADAETWLGEEFPDLLEAGIDQVVLLEGTREVYGPMSLHVA